MMLREKLIYKDETYQIYLYEEDIFHPSEVGITSVWPSTESLNYEGIYNVDNFNLILHSFTVQSDGAFPDVNGCSPKFLDSDGNKNTVVYEEVSLPLSYSGAIIIAKDFIDKYGFEEDYPCYCYKTVIELIFSEGSLITTIDHSKAMLKIRKNIDAGLRDPKVKKDERCINRFIKSSFVGEYWYKRSHKLRKFFFKTNKKRK